MFLAYPKQGTVTTTHQKTLGLIEVLELSKTLNFVLLFAVLLTFHLSCFLQ